MRRFALSMFAACGLALLTACGSGGGSAFSSASGSGSIDSIIFSNGSGQANDFFVTPLPFGTKPLEVSAIGQQGSGPSALYVNDATFTWAARFLQPTDTSISTYVAGPAPGAAKTCPASPAIQPPVPVYVQAAPAAAQVYPGYGPIGATQTAKTVFIGAVPGVAPPYCLVLVATHPGDGTVGTKTIVVSNNP